MKVQLNDKIKTPEIGTSLFSIVRGGILLLVGLMVLSGCVSKGNFDAMVDERNAALEKVASTEAELAAIAAERDTLATQRGELVNDKNNLISKVQQAEAVKEQARKDAEMAQAEIARQQSIYGKLQQTFAKEQEQNKVKVQMMKSGIKVKLDNEILFPSGSVELNDVGVDVIKRAAAELKKTPYQMLIAGYTDNVKISAKLKDRYPSNWELAGARAASVVRLFEEEGVPSAQMLALSTGENAPIASNDTPEGRSQNRRIEIILRPVAIEMH